jgi:hypothetical protein
MCGDLSDLHNIFAQVGYDQSLAATRTDLGRLVTTAGADLAQGPPAAISKAVAAVVADLKVVNDWVQTKATQSELDNNQQPADVKNHFNDVGKQYKTIDSWSAKHCR